MVERYLNAMGAIGIFLILIMAFALQIFLHELPCPLCFLQRFGFLGVALGFLMNLRFGMRPSHYAIVLLSALFAGLTALQQISFHIIPGTGAYGSPLFGLHLYTWSFILSLTIIVITTLLLAIDKQYQINIVKQMSVSYITKILFAILIFLVLANGMSVLLECGISLCPSDPIHYNWPF